jgi:hypothetical protein
MDLSPLHVHLRLNLSFGLFAWTALVGGQIRHTELQSTAAPITRDHTP